MRPTRLGWLALWLSLVASGVAHPAGAQATALVSATVPSAEDFPQIRFFVSVDDAQGVRVPALPPTVFQVLEDGSAVSEIEVRETDVGVRIVYAVHTVAPMRRRDPLGRTRFDTVRQALSQAWQQATAGGAIDDLSLVTPDGVAAAHLTDHESLAETLLALEPEFGPAAGYGLLIGALDVASSPPPAPGMESHLVFLTTLVDMPVDQDLADAVAAAEDMGIVLHAVLLGTPEQSLVLEAVRLREAAIATGGTFTVFDPERGLDGLVDFLSSRRTRYEFEYSSPAQSSGQHTVEVLLEADELVGQSEPQTFDVRVQPPQAAFVSPPTRIVRQTDDANVPLPDIPPVSQTLPLLVTFPDGHPRPLTEIRLLVDGETVESRTQPPFDQLTWDLSTLLESGRHRVQAEVIDRQGLQSATEAVMIEVQVIPGPQGWEALRPAALPMGASIVLALAVVGLVNAWVTLGRETTLAGEGPLGLRPLQRARLGARPRDLPPEALLVPMRDDGTEGTPFAWDGADLLIGTDPSLCGLLLDDASVSPLHARLVRRAGGSSVLRDQNSVAGTWVNGESVDDQGRALTHNDVIHFGRSAYRFRLTTPGPRPAVRFRPFSTPENPS
ncbi:MAG TPA: FHA domain-containing protein [Anaerolineales bacterium]|nr:FHA domain-containing protein [Anaerolineales bacterium]